MCAAIMTLRRHPRRPYSVRPRCVNGPENGTIDRTPVVVHLLILVRSSPPIVPDSRWRTSRFGGGDDVPAQLDDPPQARRPQLGILTSMKSQAGILDTLKSLLTGELTAMDVYLVQSKMFANWGYTKLHDRLSHEFDDEKGHAEKLIERILFLEGTPDMSARLPFAHGDTVLAMMRADLELELKVASNLNLAIAQAERLGDNGTRALLVPLLQDTEGDHILWFESQVEIIETVGEQRYLAEMI